MASTNCRSITPQYVCYTPAAGAAQTLVSHKIYSAEGKYVGTYYTEEGGTTAIDTSGGTVDAGVCPIARAASFSGEMTLGGTSGTVPANTYAITIYNDTNIPITVTIGGDAQVLPGRSSLNIERDRDTEQPFAAGPAAIATLAGPIGPADQVFFDYKVIA